MLRTLKLILLAMLVGLVALAPRVAAQANAEIELRAAMETETVKGDLNTAIKQYQAVVDKYAKTDRATAATALLRMAECYSKLGDQQARVVLERLTKEFADQKDIASRAAAMLAAGTKPPAINRQIWNGSGDSISADGRLISYETEGDVAIHDVITKTDRRLMVRPTPTGSYAEGSAISRNGQLVAYTWSNVKSLRYELRVADTNARPGATPRVLIDNPDISRLMPLDWSPDGSTIATRLVRGDRTTQLALVSARDGRVTVLKSIDWRGPTRAIFSGDGKYVGYDLISEDSSNQRDVFVLTVDGSHESRVVENPANDLMAGWSSDGRLLIFASDRSGSRAIWGQPLKDGRPDGQPVLLRSDVGAFVGSLGTTQNGALVFVQRTSADKVYTASVDFSTGRLVTPAAPVLETYLRGQRQPAWSWDGKSLAWASASDVMIQSLDTGRTANVHNELSSGALQSWAPDGSLTYTGFDVKGRSGLFRVDAHDGHVTPLVTDGLFGLPSWSADGKLLAYRHQMTAGGVIVVHDLSTDSQREVLAGNEAGYFALAPDGGTLAYAAPFQQPKSVRVLNLVTGSSRELLKAEGTDTFSALQWLPDSRRIVVWKAETSNTTGLVVSLAGEPPVRLDRTLPNFFRVHPDGKRIVYSVASAATEVWSLEGFLPSAKKN